jgi:hypothetical protein
VVDALSVDIQLDEDGSFETGKLTNTSPPISTRPSEQRARTKHAHVEEISVHGFPRAGIGRGGPSFQPDRLPPA